MPSSLLFIPLGLMVWMLCYGPGLACRKQDGTADWRQAAETASNPEAELAALLAVEDPERKDREG